ncbi:hypothetical protein CJ177_44255 [Rhodococcus sp. ACPA1]|nr:hypothetical protein CJ177_44255 [Rhodococcus sp. ACPA1]
MPFQLLTAPSSGVPVLPDSITVVVFDLDGVLTSTAVLHRKAWMHSIYAYLKARDATRFMEFTEHLVGPLGSSSGCWSC